MMFAMRYFITPRRDNNSGIDFSGPKLRPFPFRRALPPLPPFVSESIPLGFRRESVIALPDCWKQESERERGAEHQEENNEKRCSHRSRPNVSHTCLLQLAMCECVVGCLHNCSRSRTAPVIRAPPLLAPHSGTM